MFRGCFCYSYYHYLLSLTLICFTRSQTLVHVGIIDDTSYPRGILNLHVPNGTFCNLRGLTLQIQWLNDSSSIATLLNGIQSREHQRHIYLAKTTKFSTKVIEDFCHTYQIPFLNIHSYGTVPSMSASRTYSVIPDIFRVLTSYLKYHHIEKAVYIYNNDQATPRFYEFLRLMNNDEYFNDFTLDIRPTQYQDVYSLLYSIESHSNNKEQPTKYILLDLESYEDYETMFEKISHMGLTKDMYNYIILSAFDACLWMETTNFTGRLIYFDYQQRDCQRDYQKFPSANDKLSSLSKFKHPSSYYRSTLSFRSDPDSSKSSNSTPFLSTNSSNQTNITDPEMNFCNDQINIYDEYISYSYFLAELPSSYQLHSRSLFDSINFIIRLLRSDLIDCPNLRLKQRSGQSTFDDVNIYTRKKSNTNLFQTQIELIGRYSTLHQKYHSCNRDKRKDLAKIPIASQSRVYYITSLFDEPFLMLRKRTSLNAKYSQSPASLKQLRGRVFDFHELEGYCVGLAEKVCATLNITCRIRIVADGAFGSKNASTGSWDGMVGEIVSRTADMAIAPLTISQKRMEVVDFSKPFMNLGISIMIRKPDAQKPGVFSFMNPVSMEIWLCFSLAYFAVSVVLFLTSRVVNSGWHRRVVRRPSYRSYAYPKSVNDRRKSEVQIQRQTRDSSESAHSSELNSTMTTSSKAPVRRRHHYRTRPHSSTVSLDRAKKNKDVEQHEEDEDEQQQNDVDLFGISNALFFSFASFMRQSINLIPKSFSGRIAATSWWYFSLIFISSYTANLVAFLTVEKLVTPIESVDDLAKQDEIKYGSLRNGTTSAFFEKSNVSVFQLMWAVMQRSSGEVFVSTNDEGVAKVRNAKGKYAYFIESTKNEYVNERLPCDTMKVGSDLDSKGYGIATRLGSDLSEAINIIVTNLRESGFLDKLKQRWWYERSECYQAVKDKRFSELSLSSVTGLFYIFLFGIILSCVIAFTEFLITAKTESEKLHISFREILRIKMIENLVGVTIHAQRQLEFGRVEHECNYDYQDEEEEMIENYTQYQLRKPQSDV